MIEIKLNLFLILVLITIGYYGVNEIKNQNIVKELEVKEDEKIQALNNSNMANQSSSYDGIVIGVLEIKSIKIKKAVVKSSYEKLQKNIDLDNVVTLSHLNDSMINIFAHYYNIKDKMFNRISELTKGEEIIVYNNELNNKYHVSNYGIIKKSELKKLKDDLVLVTCTKDFSNTSYYYVSAKLVNN